MSEIFPSAFRGICVSFVAIVGRVGCMLAPLIADTLVNMDEIP